jgi:hypothetical protein
MNSDWTNMDEAEFMDGARLEPENISFPGKDKLRKTTAVLTESQVEYLSVAYLEDDLSAEQCAELEANLEQVSGNRIIFNTIQKIRLTPPSDGYKHKSSLKKLTAGQKVLRIAAAGLSAAATIAILILSSIFVPEIISDRNGRIASENIQDSNPEPIHIVRNNPIISRVEPAIVVSGNAGKTNKISTVEDPGKIPSAYEILPVSDTSPSVRIIEIQPIQSIFVPVASGIDFYFPQYRLMASNNNFTSVVADEERSRIRRFVARTFRGTFLGDDTYSEEPLRPYEIARASVDGMNKLFDWDMQLKETVDASGEVKSLYFSSALLTFNTPAKKIDK